MSLGNICPFCGSEEVVLIELDSSSWSVECKTCNATGPIKQTPLFATRAWNYCLARNNDSADLQLLRK
jgi:Lar family restriction alleviation protein